jgi:hypothetical protein
MNWKIDTLRAYFPLGGARAGNYVMENPKIYERKKKSLTTSGRPTASVWMEAEVTFTTFEEFLLLFFSIILPFNDINLYLLNLIIAFI